MTEERKKIIIRFLIFVAVVAVGVLIASVALGRAGGGHSYGGGGSGGGSSGGGEGLGILIYLVVRFLIVLCIEAPVIGIPVTVVVIAIVILLIWKKNRDEKTGADADAQYAYMASRGGANLNDMLKPLKDNDPNFSRPLFLDFVQLLYFRCQEARGRRDLSPLAAYLVPALINNESLAMDKKKGLSAVSDVVIGSSEITGVKMGAYNTISVLFEANYVEHYGPDETQDYYARELWTLRRKKGALSKGPEGMRALNCPGCGASSEPDSDGACPYCGKNIVEADFQWQVQSINIYEKVFRQPVKLGASGGVETGTKLPTVFANDLGAQRKAFGVKHPDFSWEDYQKKVEKIFLAVQDAWSTKHWDKARSYLTDHIFNTNRYWIEQYIRDGLTNKVEEVKVDRIEAAKIEKDAFFDAITVRIWAKCLDYTIQDKTKKVVDGSKKKAREFTEYWTFIRRVGASAKDPENIDTCPSCGGPLKINMAGICEYCGSHVSSGDFDWVVSAIQQDEAYRD